MLVKVSFHLAPGADRAQYLTGVLDACASGLIHAPIAGVDAYARGIVIRMTSGHVAFWPVLEIDPEPKLRRRGT